jgi:hypothetical protein
MIKMIKSRLKKWLNFKHDFGSDARQRYRDLENDFNTEYTKLEKYLFNQRIEGNKYLNNDFTHNTTSLTKLLKKLQIIQLDFAKVVAAKQAYYKAKDGKFFLQIFQN